MVAKSSRRPTAYRMQLGQTTHYVDGRSGEGWSTEFEQLKTIRCGDKDDTSQRATAPIFSKWVLMLTELYRIKR